jgi:hypothetical protein
MPSVRAYVTGDTLPVFLSSLGPPPTWSSDAIVGSGAAPGLAAVFVKAIQGMGPTVVPVGERPNGTATMHVEISGNGEFQFVGLVGTIEEWPDAPGGGDPLLQVLLDDESRVIDAAITPWPYPALALWITSGQFASFACSAVWVDVGTDDVPLVASPSVGGTAGGELVRLTGGTFLDGVTVTFDGDAATDIMIVDLQTLTCRTPAHALGLVDVVVTNPDTSTTTGSYQYVPLPMILDPGPVQRARGPAPSTATTGVTIVRDTTDTRTYAWTQVSGPATATIADPTALNTDLVFAAFVAGTYVFQLEVTDGSDLFLVSALVTVLMGPTVPPRVSSGRRHLVWAV